MLEDGVWIMMDMECGMNECIAIKRVLVLESTRQTPFLIHAHDFRRY